MECRLTTLIGQRVRQLRREKGWTQTQLAAICGYTQSYMGQVERGEKNITTETLEGIMRALEVSPSSFFTGQVFMEWNPE